MSLQAIIELYLLNLFRWWSSKLLSASGNVVSIRDATQGSIDIHRGAGRDYMANLVVAQLLFWNPRIRKKTSRSTSILRAAR